MDKTLKYSLRKLFWTLLLSYVASLVLSGAAIVLVSGFNKEQIAKVLTMTTRNSLVAGDFRSAIVVLNLAVEGQFEAISYQDSSGKTIFSVPTEAVASGMLRRTWYRAVLERPVSLQSDAQGETSGRIVYTYSRFGLLPLAIALWAFGFLASIPFAIRARRHALQNHERELERRSQAVYNQIASQVAHDVRSPLAALEVVEKSLGPVNADARELLESAISRIRAMASQLVEKCGSITPVEEAIGAHPIGALVEEIVREKLIVVGPAVSIRVLAENGVAKFPCRVQPQAFFRVLSNLLNNAVEAMPERGGRIEIYLEIDPSNRLAIRIRDDGRGIAADVLPRLFARGATFGKKGGNGLGLNHARSVVESWGGQIYISSRIGEGTEVRLLLVTI